MLKCIECGMNLRFSSSIVAKTCHLIIILHIVPHLGMALTEASTYYTFDLTNQHLRFDHAQSMVAFKLGIFETLMMSLHLLFLNHFC